MYTLDLWFCSLREIHQARVHLLLKTGSFCRDTFGEESIREDVQPWSNCSPVKQAGMIAALLLDMHDLR